MFELLDGRTELFQWDTNRRLTIADKTINEVHFCNRTDDCSLVCEVFEENGMRLVGVPDILLQYDLPIRAYAYCGDEYTKAARTFKVRARTKPADYVYVDVSSIPVVNEVRY